MTVLIINY